MSPLSVFLNGLRKIFAGVSACLIALAPFFISPAYAAIPQTISYQSRLLDSAGAAVTSATAIQFSLYTHPTNGSYSDVPSASGSLVWKETYDQPAGACASIVPDAKGYFFLRLGSCSVFPSYLTFNEPLYLGVKIGSDPEATPRVPFSAHPYALNSERVNNLQATTTAQANQLLALDDNQNFNIATGTFMGAGLSITGTSTLQNLTFTMATGTFLNLTTALALNGIRLDAVGTNNVTSGASLIGVFDEFDNSDATTVQAALRDFDLAITSVSSSVFAMTLQKVTDNGNTTTNPIVFAGGTSTAALHLFGQDTVGMSDAARATKLFNILGGASYDAVLNINADDGMGAGSEAGIRINSDYNGGGGGGIIRFSNNGVSQSFIESDPGELRIVSMNPGNLVDVITSNIHQFRFESNGNFGVGNAIANLFKLQVSGNAGPSVHNTYDLGAATTSWRNIWASGFVSTTQLFVNGQELNGGVGGTLEDAYNYGGSGAGRLITADGGPISISGMSHDDGALEVISKNNSEAIWVDNQADGNAFSTINAGAGSGLYVNNQGVGNGIYEDNNNNVGSGLYIANNMNGKGILVDNIGMGDGITIEHSGARTGFRINNTGTGRGAYVRNDQGTGFEIDNYSALYSGLHVSNNSTGDGIYVESSGGSGISVSDTGSKAAIKVNSTAGSANMLELINTADARPIYIVHGGTQEGFFMRNSGTGPSLWVEDGATDTTPFVLDANGRLGVNTSNTNNFNITSGGHVGPSVNNAYDLGSATTSWRRLYVTNVSSTRIDAARYVSTTLLSAETLTVNGNATIGNANTDRISFNSLVSSDFVPDVDNIRSLGSTSNRWKNLWATNATFTSLYVNGTQVTGIAPTLQQVTDNGNSTTNKIQFAGGTSTGQFIVNGKLGIGTDHPIFTTDIHSDDNVLSIWRNSLGEGIAIVNDEIGDEVGISDIRTDGIIAAVSKADSNLYYYGNKVLNVRYDSAGSNNAVGIGTSNPDSLLHVYSDTQDSVLKVESGGGQNAYMILDFDRTGGGEGSLSFRENGTQKGIINSGNNVYDYFAVAADHGAALDLTTNGSVRMHIDPTGRVGVNATNTSNFNLTSGGHVGPSVNNAYDLGSATTSWRDIYASGTIYGNVAGTINPGFTEGSVIFQGASGLAENNSNLYWDDTNGYLGIGTVSPSAALTLNGDVDFTAAADRNIGVGFTFGSHGKSLNITAGSANGFGGSQGGGNLTLAAGNGGPMTGGGGNTYVLGGSGGGNYGNVLLAYDPALDAQRGNVGIGKVSYPNHSLDLRTDDSILASFTNSTNDEGVMVVNGNLGDEIGLSDIRTDGVIAGVSQADPTLFYYGNQVLNVVAGGGGGAINRVGIGTTNPLNQLHVEGGIYIASTTPDTTTNSLYNQGGDLFWNGSPLAGIGGTLEDAYNYGGSGAGRFITADGGPISISGMSHDDGALEVISKNNSEAIWVDNQADGDAFSTTNSGAGSGFYVSNEGVGNGLTVDGNSGANGIYVLNDHMGKGIMVDNTSQGDGITIENSGNRTGFRINNSGTGRGAYVRNDQGTGFEIDNYSASYYGLHINNNSTGYGAYIESSGGSGIYVDDTGSKAGIKVNTTAGSGNMLELINTADARPIDIEHGGTQEGFFMRNSGTGPSLWVEDSATDTTPFVLDANGRLGVNTTDTTMFNVTSNGDVGPADDGAFDLGSAIRTWRNIYASGFVSNGVNVGIGTSTPNVRLNVAQSGNTVAAFDRLANDGTLLDFRRDGASVGSISVAAGVVSYNAFSGSHYAWTDESIEAGEIVTLTGNNRRQHDAQNSEIVYGITAATSSNDPRVLGAYVGLLNPSEPGSNANPHLVNAVGNGDVWVADKGVNIAAGDYLISSDIQGHAMKDTGANPVSYVFARAAEPLDWSQVTATVDGVKHAKVSVFFESFARNNSIAAIQPAAIGNVLQSGAVYGPTSTELTVVNTTFPGTVTVLDHMELSKDSVGQAVILVGATRVHVAFDKAYDNLPIVTVTPHGVRRVDYGVENVSLTGFDIAIDPIQYKDMLFDWHAFGEREAKVSVSNGTTSDIELTDMGTSKLETQINATTQPESVPVTEEPTQEASSTVADTTVINSEAQTSSTQPEVVASQPELPIDNTTSTIE